MSRAPTRLSAVKPALPAWATNRHWWGDGPPTWIEGRGRSWQRPCLTATDAETRREQHGNLLRRWAIAKPTATHVADRLDGCHPRSQCLSGACPSCTRALQRWFVAEGRRLMRTSLNDKPLLMATVVPDFANVPLSRLTEFDLAACTRRLKRKLANAGVSQAFGGIDVSVNIDRASGKPSIVQFQYTLFLSLERGNWEKALKLSLNRSKTIERPFVVKFFDGKKVGLAYALKSNFVKRETYYANNAHRDDRTGCANTRNRELRGEAWALVMIFLDQIGLDERLFLLGLKKIISKEKVRIRPIAVGSCNRESREHDHNFLQRGPKTHRKAELVKPSG